MNVIPDLSVCVATTANRPDILERFLDSVRRMDDHLSIEVIIVDRYGQEKSSLPAVKSFGSVKLVDADAGCSLPFVLDHAMGISTGRYISLWSDTVVLEPESLVRLVAFLDEHPDTGVVAPAMWTAAGDFQSVARAFPSLLELSSSSSVPGPPMTMPGEGGNTEPEWFSGPGLTVNRFLLEETGGLSEKFLCYWPLEYCLRAAGAGWHLQYCHEARIIGAQNSWPVERMGRLSLYQAKMAVALMIVRHRLRA